MCKRKLGLAGAAHEMAKKSHDNRVAGGAASSQVVGETVSGLFNTNTDISTIVGDLPPYNFASGTAPGVASGATAGGASGTAPGGISGAPLQRVSSSPQTVREVAQMINEIELLDMKVRTRPVIYEGFNKSTHEYQMRLGELKSEKTMGQLLLQATHEPVTTCIKTREEDLDIFSSNHLETDNASSLDMLEEFNDLESHLGGDLHGCSGRDLSVFFSRIKPVEVKEGVSNQEAFDRAIRQCDNRPYKAQTIINHLSGSEDAEDRVQFIVGKDAVSFQDNGPEVCLMCRDILKGILRNSTNYRIAGYGSYVDRLLAHVKGQGKVAQHVDLGRGSEHLFKQDCQKYLKSADGHRVRRDSPSFR